jgi:hypothetical protein
VAGYVLALAIGLNPEVWNREATKGSGPQISLNLLPSSWYPFPFTLLFFETHSIYLSYPRHSPEDDNYNVCLNFGRTSSDNAAHTQRLILYIRHWLLKLKIRILASVDTLTQ